MYLDYTHPASRWLSAILLHSPATSTWMLLRHPNSVGLSVAPISPGDEIPSTDTTRRLWRFGNGWGGGLSNESEIDYPFQQAEFVNGDGLYLAELDTLWKSSGSVDYGFLIQVGSGSSGLTSYLPTNSEIPIPTPATISLQTIFPLVRLGKGAAFSTALSPDGRTHCDRHHARCICLRDEHTERGLVQGISQHAHNADIQPERAQTGGWVDHKPPHSP